MVGNVHGSRCNEGPNMQHVRLACKVPFLVSHIDPKLEGNTTTLGYEERTKKFVSRIELTHL